MAKVVIGGDAEYGSWGQSNIATSLAERLNLSLTAPLGVAVHGYYSTDTDNQVSYSASKINSEYEMDGVTVSSALSGSNLGTANAVYKSLSVTTTDTYDPNYKAVESWTIDAFGYEPSGADFSKYDVKYSYGDGVSYKGSASGQWVGDGFFDRSGYIAALTTKSQGSDVYSWTEDGVKFSVTDKFSFSSLKGIESYGFYETDLGYPTVEIATGDVNLIEYSWSSKAGSTTVTESYSSKDVNANFVEAAINYSLYSDEDEEYYTEELMLALFSGDDDISGSAFDDDIWGYSGADKVDGKAGDDLIWGGTGRDTLTGGTGADEFHFYFGDSSMIRSARDVVTDFKGVDGDRIFLGVDNMVYSSVSQSVSYSQAREKAQNQMDSNYDSGVNVVFGADKSTGYIFVDFTADGVIDEVIGLTKVTSFDGDWVLY